MDSQESDAGQYTCVAELGQHWAEATFLLYPKSTSIPWTHFAAGLSKRELEL